VRELALPSDAAQTLATLRARTNLRLPDCCVLLAAQREQARLLTFDSRLRKYTKQVGVAVVDA
jgi:predicted nucleic acid-binding protein